MPILTYTSSEGPRGGILNSRVLIGRRLSHGIAFSDPSVSRLHAWIDPLADEQAGWVVTDAGSKTGTFVNDQKITRHHLNDGDIIRVGKSALVYHDQQLLPDGVTPVELIPSPPIVRGSGILFECTCGAPLWVGNELAGKRGICRHCRRPITVPKLEPDEIFPPPVLPVEEPPLAASRIEQSPFAEPETTEPPHTAESEEPHPVDEPTAETTNSQPVEDSPTPPPLAASRIDESPFARSETDEPAQPSDPEEEPIEEATASHPAAEPLGSLGTAPVPSVIVDASTKRKNKCAVCHSPIVPGEEMVTCPDCAMTFHAECWNENLGCSSYGCPKVNCLQPGKPKPMPVGGLLSESNVVEDTPTTRWEPILLAASILGSAFGSVLFGSLPAIVALVCLVILARKKSNRPGLLIAAILICIVGIAGGLAVSDLLYFNAKHLPPLVAKYLHF